jgi:prevent-host-death family protein
MRSWPVQDAKARFSELLNSCEQEGAQLVTRRGEEAAVLLPIAEWRRLTAARPGLKSLLLAPEPRSDALAPTERGKARHRAAPDY